MADICPICREGLEKDIVYPVSSAGPDRRRCRKHLYHFLCLATCFQSSADIAQCPLCKQEFDQWVCVNDVGNPSQPEQMVGEDSFLRLVIEIHSFEQKSKQLEYFQQVAEKRLDWFMNKFTELKNMGHALNAKLTAYIGGSDIQRDRDGSLQHFEIEFKKLNEIELYMKQQMQQIMQDEKIFD